MLYGENFRQATPIPTPVVQPQDSDVDFTDAYGENFRQAQPIPPAIPQQGTRPPDAIGPQIPVVTPPAIPQSGTRPPDAIGPQIPVPPPARPISQVDDFSGTPVPQVDDFKWT